MKLKTAVALSLSLFVMSLSSHVAANTLHETTQTLKPVLSIEQQDLKKEINSSAYLKRVATTLAPFLSGACSTEVSEFTRTQWNNSCNTTHHLYDGNVAEYKSISYDGFLAGYIEKTPVFIINSETVDAMFFKANDAKSQMKPFIVLTTGLVNTFADNPVGMDFTLRHEYGHIKYNHTPSPIGANDDTSLRNTTSNELEADTEGLAYIKTKYTGPEIQQGLKSMAEELNADFVTLPATVRHQMKTLFDTRMNVLYQQLEASPPKSLAFER